MDIIIKNLLKDLGNSDYKRMEQISRFKIIMMVHTLKDRLEHIVQELLDKVAEKEGEIDHLAKENQELLRNYKSVDVILSDAAELRAKAKRLEEENASLKSRIKLLISFENKNKESAYSEKAENQLRTSSSLTSENCGKRQDTCKSSFTPCDYSHIRERIKALEKGVDDLLDSPNLKPFRVKDEDRDVKSLASTKAKRHSSYIGKSAEHSSSLIKFNCGYTKINNY